MRWPLVWRSTLEFREHTAESRIVAIAQSRNEAQADADKWHGKASELRDELERTNATIASLRADFASSERSRAELADMYAARVTDLESTITTLRDYVVTRDKIIADLETNSAALRAEARDWSAIASEATARAETAETKLAALTKAPEQPKRSKLTDVIREQATGADGTINKGLLAHFRNRANQLRRQNKSESEIIEAIENGWTTTSGLDAVPSVDEILAQFEDESLT